MEKEKFYDYIQTNFNIGGDASRLIRNILNYAEGMERGEKYNFLCAILDGTIGLTDDEIKRFCN